MDPYGNTESAVFSSADESKAEHAGTGTLNEETYCADQLNVSGNSCDCAGYFEMPDCVMDVYLQALDGGDESNAALRNISNVYGPKEDVQEIDTNCNHNFNPEPRPNEGCGCTSSYNGGAGGGTAVCSCSRDPYEQGFRDKKREFSRCCAQDETYQMGLVNKKPDYTDEYNVPSASFLSSSDRFESISLPFDDTYQQPLANKKPESPDAYIPVIPPLDPYSGGSCSSCNGGRDSFALQRYDSRSPDRSSFYGED